VLVVRSVGDRGLGYDKKEDGLKMTQNALIRKSAERGHVNHGWLEARHSFSFGDYHDPRFMRFRTMRVLNEDHLEAAQGFPMHPHEDMEIVTYVIAGALKHEDNMGNASVIQAGEVQRMSAGTGVVHSEFNPSKDAQTHLLQIWFLPRDKGIAPGYEQRTFARDQKLNQLRLIASADEKADALHVHQDVEIFASILEPEKTLHYSAAEGRALWIQLARGLLRVNQQEIAMGDAFALKEAATLTIEALEEAEFLLFDLK